MNAINNLFITITFFVVSGVSLLFAQAAPTTQDKSDVNKNMQSAQSQMQSQDIVSDVNQKKSSKALIKPQPKMPSQQHVKQDEPQMLLQKGGQQQVDLQEKLPMPPQKEEQHMNPQAQQKKQ